MPTKALDQHDLQRAVRFLAKKDRILGQIASRFGIPPLWARPQSLATLVLMILEQQVSIVSARAVYDRIRIKIGTPKAPALLALGNRGLRKLGVTRQKARYIHGLAEASVNKELRLAALRHRTDDEVRAQLTRFTGIGEWTANVYLLMALRRPDVWPVGDIALHSAVGRLYQYAQRPSSQQAANHALDWVPYRSVAARMLWQWYLATGTKPA